MRRLDQEILLASKISHKNFIHIHDYGDAGGLKFIVADFVEGRDLHETTMKFGLLPVDRALMFLHQICAALDAAHRAGVVSQDLTPRDILVDPLDNICVSILRVVTSQYSRGNPRYTSPEDLLGTKVDHRADLYALGLIAYEMFTGRFPYEDRSVPATVYRKLNERAEDPRTLRREIPDYVARIILKCLEKDPANRYQSASEILRDLKARKFGARFPSAWRAIRSLLLIPKSR
jgi:serine/threonine-protein kinase